MKKSILLFFFISIAAALSAQNKSVDTASFTVNGLCGMCEERIENAAYIKGVKKVDWDKEKQMLTIIYKPKKVTVEEVAQSVADAGHDNDYFKASDKAYGLVHNCCRYREGEVH
jgi:copper chaperone CopZ